MHVCVCVQMANVVDIPTYLPGGIAHAVLATIGTGTSGGEASSPILIELQVINSRQDSLLIYVMENANLHIS